MSKAIDLTGKIFGQLTVIEMLPERKCRCRCSCGNETIVYRSNLANGHTKSCGCLKYSLKSKVGTKQGHLLLIELYKDNGSKPRYRCICECGREVNIRYDSPTQSCGQCGAFYDERTEALHGCGEFVEGTQLSKLTSTPTASNKSGVVGVNWDKSRRKWKASIRFQRHKYNLGRFDNIQDAIDARKKAEKELFDEFLKRHGK